MYSIKNKLFLTISLLSNSYSFIFAEELVEDYATGKVKIAHIMENEETGIAAYNAKNMHYAQTQNLAQDLNTAEIAKFFDCKTLMGNSFLAQTLEHPLSPEDRDSAIAKRQHIIRELVENPALKKEVDQLLLIAKTHEQEVIKLMSDFFKGKTCPEMANLELLKKQSPKLFPLMDFFYTNPTGKSISTAINYLGIAGLGYATWIFGNIARQQMKAGIDYTQAAFYTGYFGLIIGFYSYNAYYDYKTAYEKRTKMHSLNQLIDCAEKCEKLSEKYGLKMQFKMSSIEDEHGVAMIESLKDSRYKYKNTIFFLTPFVHTFLYKVYQNEKHLAQLFACIAELDAYNSIATKIIEGQNTNNKFCFAQFVENEKPVIKAQAFWNVLVKKAVPSSITESKSIILTGPNAGGKTTAIRALLQNIVLAQSFGIAAAQEFSFTQFDVIHSYLNISDDLINGLSLFASEVKRAQEIVQKIKSLGNKQKFFFALDELFTGTAAEEGQTCAFNFIKSIAKFEHIQFIYATHFNKLKDLGKEESYCTNYKVDAPTKNAQNVLVYPFTLSKGASNVNVALELAKQAQLFE